MNGFTTGTPRPNPSWTNRSTSLCLLLAGLLLAGAPGIAPRAAAQDQAAQSDPVARIRDEGLNRSQVMQTLSYLTDVIGPRLTGSPNLKRANEWTRGRLEGWGLQDAHLEPWGPFGRGWSLERFSAQVIEPQAIPLIAYPKAWSPGTSGPIEAEVVYLDAKDVAGLEKYRGRLRGAIVLAGEPREVKAHFEAQGVRRTDAELLELANASGAPRGRRTGTGRPMASPEQQARLEFQRRRLPFLIEEGAAAIADCSSQGDGGTIFVASASVPQPSSAGANDNPFVRGISPWQKDAPKTLPQFTVSVEHYNRMVRMIQAGEKLRMALDLRVRFHDEDPMAYNTLAEIPGSDLRDQIVMLGGHMDSWHSGTGATDNGAGVAACMEAVRILKVLNLQPRRSVRIALWTGEEQGLLGSRAYVAQHFRKSPPTGAPAGSLGETMPEYEKLSAYYNLDVGTGKVRGVYLAGNEAATPLFRQWLAPFRETGAQTLSLSDQFGTDHNSFNSAGLPGFQFIQDPIEYFSRTHHSNQDLFDRIQADDLKQAAVLMAAFVYQTAMVDERIPRRPTPAPRTGTAAPAR